MIPEDKPTPADKQLVWIVVAFIVLMLGLMLLHRLRLLFCVHRLML